MQLIPMSLAILCVNCGVVSDTDGEECPGCAGRGGLLNLSNLLTREIDALEEVQIVKAKGNC